MLPRRSPGTPNWNSLERDTGVEIEDAALGVDKGGASGDQAGGIADHGGDHADVGKGDLVGLLSPAESGGEALILCLGGESRISKRLVVSTATGIMAHRKASQRTKEVLDEGAVHSAGGHVAKDNDGGGNLAEAEVLHVGGEGVVGVEGLGHDLAGKLAVGQHVGGERIGSPEDTGGVEDGLVKDVVVAEEGIGARHAGIVLENVVTVQHVEREEGGVGLRVGNQRHLEHEVAEAAVEAESVEQTLDDGITGQVLAVVGDEVVVGKSVHHRARAADYTSHCC
jgi:hypothetical protein